MTQTTLSLANLDDKAMLHACDALRAAQDTFPQEPLRALFTRYARCGTLGECPSGKVSMLHGDWVWSITDESFRSRIPLEIFRAAFLLSEAAGVRPCLQRVFVSGSSPALLTEAMAILTPDVLAVLPTPAGFFQFGRSLAPEVCAELLERGTVLLRKAPNTAHGRTDLLARVRVGMESIEAAFVHMFESRRLHMRADLPKFFASALERALLHIAADSSKTA